VALQALFECDTAHHDPDACLSARMEDTPLPEAGARYARDLVLGALEHLSAIDAIIQRIAPEWPVEQMSPIDRNILRLASYEILYTDDTPPKVCINEAVEVAKAFGSDSSSRFVNGVLGTLLTNRNDLSNWVRSHRDEELPAAIIAHPAKGSHTASGRPS